MTFFFVDKGTQRGVAYEAFRRFEYDLNKKLKSKQLRVNVVFIPVSRDELQPAPENLEKGTAFGSEIFEFQYMRL